MSGNSVFIITTSCRQANGSFDQSIASVWTTKEAAREELKRIKAGYDREDLRDTYRARTPNCQIDDLSVEVLKGNFWECISFYSILTKPLQS